MFSRIIFYTAEQYETSRGGVSFKLKKASRKKLEKLLTDFAPCIDDPPHYDIQLCNRLGETVYIRVDIRN